MYVVGSDFRAHKSAAPLKHLLAIPSDQTIEISALTKARLR